MQYQEIFEAVKTRLRVALVRGDTAIGAQGVREFREKYIALSDASGLPDSVAKVLDKVMARAKHAEPILVGMLAAVSATQLPPAPAAYAQHWYNADGQAISPPAGGWRLIVGMNATAGVGQFVSDQRLLRQFGSHGLQLILMTQTSGHFHGHVYKDPAQEAEQIRAYLQDTAHAPGTLGIYETQFTRLWDGRYRAQRSPNAFLNGGGVLVRPQDDCYTIAQIGYLPNGLWTEKFFARILHAEMSHRP
jgi:hypothetical protein